MFFPTLFSDVSWMHESWSWLFGSPVAKFVSDTHGSFLELARAPVLAPYIESHLVDAHIFVIVDGLASFKVCISTTQKVRSSSRDVCKCEGPHVLPRVLKRDRGRSSRQETPARVHAWSAIEFRLDAVRVVPHRSLPTLISPERLSEEM